MRVVLGIDLAGESKPDTSVVAMALNKTIRVLDKCHKKGKHKGKRKKWTNKDLRKYVLRRTAVMDAPHHTQARFSDLSYKYTDDELDQMDPTLRAGELVARRYMAKQAERYKNFLRKHGCPEKEITAMVNGSIFKTQIVQPAHACRTNIRPKQIYTERPVGVKRDRHDIMLKNRIQGIGGGDTIPGVDQVKFAEALFDIGDYDSYAIFAIKNKTTPGSDGASRRERKKLSNTAEVKQLRRDKIDILVKYGIINGPESQLQKCADDDDAYDALWCAITAWNLEYGDVERFGEGEMGADLEGVVLVPVFKLTKLP